MDTQKPCKGCGATHYVPVPKEPNYVQCTFCKSQSLIADITIVKQTVVNSSVNVSGNGNVIIQGNGCSNNIIIGGKRILR